MLYVGVDLHRKASQVAVVDEQGKLIFNRHVPSQREPEKPGSHGRPAARGSDSSAGNGSGPSPSACGPAAAPPWSGAEVGLGALPGHGGQLPPLTAAF